MYAGKRRRDRRTTAAATGGVNVVAPAAAAALGPSSVVGSFSLSAEQRAGVLETAAHVIKNLPEYRNRNEETMDYIKEHFPDYYEKVVFKLSDEMKADKSRHYFKATRDFHYHLLVGDPMKAFLSHGKKWKDKEKRIQYGQSHVRKYHDAVVRCAEFSGGYHLSQQYLDEMSAYIDSMKREKAAAKQNNQIEEKDADPIGIDLYGEIAEWAIEEGTPSGILVWASSVTQWNVLGRPINVDALAFHNMQKGQNDSIIVSYDKNKKDQTGKKVSPKNCFSNPRKPEISFFLAMGCYLCINQGRYGSRRSDKIFIKAGQDGSASDSYQKGLKKLLSDPKKRQKIMDSIREGHFHAYGYRKGGATHVTTATMDPPPVPSVMLRGEWSLGGSLDVYWFFSIIGDTYLGRILAGFDPDGEDFDTLPPHFKEGTENKYIAEAMTITFGQILKKFPAMQSCLLLFLASIVYHQSFLRKYIATNPKHPFINITILHQQDLLKELTALVTLEPCGEVKKATGVPRHHKLLKLIGKIVKGNTQVLELVKKEVASIPTLVRESINAAAEKAGNVTVPMVMGEVGKIADRIEEVVAKQVSAALREYEQVRPIPAAPLPTPTAPSLNLNGGNAGTTLGPTYSYVDPDAKGKKVKGKSQVFSVPKDYQFPRSYLVTAWTFWFCGISEEDGRVRVPPFRYLMPKMLPHKTRKHFNDCWAPIMHYMEEALKSNDEFLPFPTNVPSTQFIADSFEAAKASLEQEHPSIFEKGGHDSWVVATWSKELRDSRKRKASAL